MSVIYDITYDIRICCNRVLFACNGDPFAHKSQRDRDTSGAKIDSFKIWIMDRDWKDESGRNAMPKGERHWLETLLSD